MANNHQIQVFLLVRVTVYFVPIKWNGDATCVCHPVRFYCGSTKSITRKYDFLCFCTEKFWDKFVAL
jgi:hypothetical protein